MKQVTTLTWVLGSVSLLGVAVMGSPAMAQVTDNLVVKANVSGTCSVTGGELDFGTYSGSEVLSDTPISFSCSAPSNVTIQLDGGTTSDPSDRQMFNTANTDKINYSLFQDAARNTLWGVLPGNAKLFPNTTGEAPSVFGRITGGQSPLPDSYSDTVLITLTTN